MAVKKGRGAIYTYDARDWPLKAAKLSEIQLREQEWNVNKLLDQKTTNQCVAYSGEHYLISSPVKNSLYKTPEKLYKECQKVDGLKHKGDDGSNIRGLFKVLSREGYIKEYRWGSNSNEIASHILTEGPVVAQSAVWDNWYFNKGGFLNDSGSFEGWHAYLLSGVYLDKKCPDGTYGAFWMINSWGVRWGYAGGAWIAMSFFDMLLENNGAQAVTGIEKLFVV